MGRLKLKSLFGGGKSRGEAGRAAAETEHAPGSSSSLPADNKDLGCLVLSPGSEASDEGVDLVFVHGLRGSRLGTWSKGDVCWPRDLLGQDLKDAGIDARIIAWGYDSQVADLTRYASQQSFSSFGGDLITDITSLRDGVVSGSFPSLCPFFWLNTQLIVADCRLALSFSWSTASAGWSSNRLSSRPLSTIGSLVSRMKPNSTPQRSQSCFTVHPTAEVDWLDMVTFSSTSQSCPCANRTASCSTLFGGTRI